MTQTPDKPAHTPEPGTKCCQQVHDGGRWPSFHNCMRKAVTIESGKPYCKTHAPSAIRAKQEEASAKHAAYWKEKHAKAQREEDCVNACKGIADPAKAIEQARAALKDAQLQIEYLHDKFRPTGSGNRVIAQIDEALSLLGAKDGREGL